ncbi:MAG: RNA-binding protein, partial [Syntrophales bacterium]|nr:RNA-binding protein [Syntrophales bacterium]
MKYIMGNLNKGTKEEFVASLLKKFKPIDIEMLEQKDGCKAIVEFPSDEVAQQAVAFFAGKKNALVPLPADRKETPSPLKTPMVTTRDAAAPYRFVKRRFVPKGLPERRHAALADQGFDIAFEIVWRTETPTAANPCSTGGDKTCPTNEKNHYQGYDNRWLMIANRLAISPFTVKSAIANGVAALLGSCYRVMDGKIEGHKGDLTEGTYPYNGAYKRYRVAMDNSKPGILRAINYETGDVTIEKVTEYYYNAPNPPKGLTFIKGKPYYARVKGRNVVKQPEDISDQPLPSYTTPLFYVGPYRFGMDLTLGPGQFKTKHYHRFCRLSGQRISGRISPINLRPLDEQKRHVHMGIFKKLEQTAALDPRRNDAVVGKPWHQDLTTFAPEQTDDLAKNWVYYQSFGGKVTAIGKNFQFKTAFRHSETVPVGQAVCTDVTRLCPRCKLFGMVDATGRGDRQAAGFKGRFKSATLINDLPLQPVVHQGTIRYGKNREYPVPLHRWLKDDQVISAQFLLPI